MKWFGPAPFSNVCLVSEKTDPPIDSVCGWCEEAILVHESGYLIEHVSTSISLMPFHVECWMRSVYGSYGHIAGRCPCVGGTLEDPPNCTKREAAAIAVAAHMAKMRGVTNESLLELEPLLLKPPTRH